MDVPKKFKTRTTCDPAIPLLSMYPKEMRGRRDRSSMFFAFYGLSRTCSDQHSCIGLLPI